MGKLRRERDLVLHDPHPRRHVAARRVSLPVEHDVLGRITVAQQRRQLPILGHQPVARGVRRHRRAHDRGLLAGDRGEGPQTALSLQAPASCVEGAPEHHEAQGFEHALVVKRRLHAGGELAGLTQQPDGRDRFFGGGELRFDTHRRWLATRCRGGMMPDHCAPRFTVAPEPAAGARESMRYARSRVGGGGDEAPWHTARSREPGGSRRRPCSRRHGSVRAGDGGGPGGRGQAQAAPIQRRVSAGSRRAPDQPADPAATGDLARQVTSAGVSKPSAGSGPSVRKGQWAIRTGVCAFVRIWRVAPPKTNWRKRPWV